MKSHPDPPCVTVVPFCSNPKPGALVGSLLSPAAYVPCPSMHLWNAGDATHLENRSRALLGRHVAGSTPDPIFQHLMDHGARVNIANSLGTNTIPRQLCSNNRAKV